MLLGARESAPAERFPNSQPYRVANPSAATGRAGSAELFARALIGKDRTTSVEISTAALDTGQTPPGDLTKLQIKALDDFGNTVFTRNYRDIEGGKQFGVVYGDLGHGQPFQVQGTVRGIDGDRSDVVTVAGNVKARPDLEVGPITAPGRAFAGAVVNVLAVVRELNGDLGARGDCVLFADGVEVDRSSGIWVDAGDAVTCAFSAKFETAGEKVLTVAVSDVVPGDWDAANNVRSAAIDVAEPQLDAVAAWVGDYDWSSTARGWRTYSYSGWFGSSWGNQTYWENQTVSWSRNTSYSAYVYGLTFAHPIAQVATSLVVDGRALHGGLFTAFDVGAWGDASTGQRCESSEEVVADLAARIYVCSYWSPASRYSHVAYETHGTGVTYFSHQHGFWWNCSSSGCSTGYSWMWNWSTQQSGTPRIGVIGQRYDFDVAVTDASVTVNGPITVSTTPTTSSWTSPRDCWGYNPTECRENASAQTYSSGGNSR